VWTSKNQYYITGFSVDQHFPDETVRVEKYVAGRIYSLCYFDREQSYYYMKRFQLELSEKMQSFLDEDATADFVCITGVEGAKLQVTYKGAHAARPADEVDVDSFIGVKSHRAKGKRITTYDVDSLLFIEPEQPTPSEPIDDDVVDEENAPEIDLASMTEAVASREVEVEVTADTVPEAEHEHVLTIDPEQLNLF
jgi:topoisomerase-4 subunit A